MMRVIIFSLALVLLTSLAEAEFVTVVPVQSGSQIQNANIVDNYGKSVTVRFWSNAKSELSAAMNSINYNSNSLIEAPASTGQGQMFGFYLNAQQQPGCDSAFAQTADELQMQNAVPVETPAKPVVLRSEALTAQLLQNLPSGNGIDEEYAQLPQANTGNAASEDFSESMLASNTSSALDSSILSASSGKSILDYLLSSPQGEESLGYNAPSSLDNVILASSLAGNGSGGSLGADNPAEVPEPSSIVLLLAGVGGLYWTRRRLTAKR